MSICRGAAGLRGGNPRGIFIHNDAGSQNANAAFYRKWLQTHPLENGFAHAYVASDGILYAEGDVSGTVQGVTHIQTDEAAAAGEAGNDRTALTLSKAVKAGCKVIALERTDTVAGMTTDDIAALKGVLKQYE